MDETVRAPHSPLPAYYATPEARRGFIARAFDAAAGDYERVDRLLAFGSGAWYRRQALLRAGLAPGMRMLDVAVGTGLVALGSDDPVVLANSVIEAAPGPLVTRGPSLAPSIVTVTVCAALVVPSATARS